MKQRIRYLKKDSYSVTKKTCVHCGKTIKPFERHWQLVEILSKVPYIPFLIFLNWFPFGKRQSEHLCRTCAPTKSDFIVYFGQRMIQKSVAIQNGMIETFNKTRKQARRSLSKKRRAKTGPDGKCACGSGKLYKNCCKKNAKRK